MPRDKNEPREVVYNNHTFYWKTDLSNKRMKEINDWLGTLTKNQKQMVEDLLSDQREEDAFNNAGEGI